jgi:hypothetical protein
MKVNFKGTFEDMEGKEILSGDKPTTLKTIAINALMATYTDEQNLSGEDKLKRWKMGQRIVNDEEDFSVEDIALLKKLIGKAYSTIIVGQAYEMLEG